MSPLIVIAKADVEQYLDKVVRVNENIHTVLLCIFDNGYYTSVGYAERIYKADESADTKYVMYNAAAALNLPLNWMELKVRKASITVSDNGFTVSCTKEKFNIKSIDFKTCKDIWNREQFKTIELPSIYTLSDGSNTNMIVLDL